MKLLLPKFPAEILFLHFCKSSLGLGAVRAKVSQRQKPYQVATV